MGSPNIAVFPASASCTIPWEGTVCSVTLQIFNPTRLPVQLWVFGLNGLETQVTGTFTDTTYLVDIPWIAAGDFYFLLYDVTGGMIRLVATKKVTGVY
jgi:hypothetical protein